MIKGNGGTGFYLGNMNGYTPSAALYHTGVTPSTSNYAFAATTTSTNLNASSTVNISVANANVVQFDATRSYFITTLGANTDNTIDIGQSGAYRFRTGYFGTSVDITSGITTGNALNIASSTATSGNLALITSTSTAAASNTLNGLKISMSGANGTASQTVTGQTISVTNTGTTGVNVGLSVTATGAATNYALIVPAGQVGIGISTPTSSALHVVGLDNTYTLRVTGGTTTGQSYGLLLNSGTNSSDVSAVFYNKAVTNANLYIRGDGNVGFSTTSPNSTTHINGSFALAYRAITALRTLDATDYTINCTANSFTVTLPLSTSITGRIYNIKNTGTGTITIATTSGELVDNYASGTLTLPQWTNLKVQSSGGGWIIL